MDFNFHPGKYEKSNISYICRKLTFPRRMSTGRIQIKFESESHQIDANTLINALVHYNALLAVVNENYGDGTKRIDIKVNALREGSFVIDLSLVSGLISALFSSGAAEYLANVVTISQAVLAAYKKLKGQPASTPETQASIKIGGADITINNSVVTIYNLPATRESISKVIETASQDGAVSGMSVTADGNPDVVIGRDEFESLIYDEFDVERLPEERIVEDDNATLTITDLSFRSKGAWQFIYRGFRIRMAVRDAALMDMINGGAQFGKGDSIRVKLRIIQRYNEEYGVYENRTFKIVEFYEHIKAGPDSPTLF